MDGLCCNYVTVDNGTSLFDLTLIATEEKEYLNFNIEYSIDLFKERTIERMASDLIHLLNEISVVSNPSKERDQLPLLTDEERYEL